MSIHFGAVTEVIFPPEYENAHLSWKTQLITILSSSLPKDAFEKRTGKPGHLIMLPAGAIDAENSIAAFQALASLNKNHYKMRYFIVTGNDWQQISQLHNTLPKTEKPNLARIIYWVLIGQDIIKKAKKLSNASLPGFPLTYLGGIIAGRDALDNTSKTPQFTPYNGLVTGADDPGIKISY